MQSLDFVSSRATKTNKGVPTIQLMADDESTQRICEGCSLPFVAPGLGRPRRFCFVCSPPKLAGLVRCAHGLPSARPCVRCFLIGVQKRKLPVRGGHATGSYVRRLEARIPAEHDRIAAELRALAESGFDAEQQAQVRAVLRSDHRQGLKDLRAALREARAAA
jgi:hypothetical protein